MIPISPRQDRRNLERVRTLIRQPHLTSSDIDDIIDVLRKTSTHGSIYLAALKLTGTSLEQLRQLINLAFDYGNASLSAAIEQLDGRPDVTEEFMSHILFRSGASRHSPLRRTLPAHVRFYGANGGWLSVALAVAAAERCHSADQAAVLLSSVRAELAEDPLGLSIFAEVGVSYPMELDELISVTRVLTDWLTRSGGTLDTLRNPQAFTEAVLNTPPDAELLTIYSRYVNKRVTELTSDDLVALTGISTWSAADLLRLLGGLCRLRGDWARGGAAVAVHPNADLDVQAQLQVSNVCGGDGTTLDEALTSRGSLIPTVCRFFNVAGGPPPAAVVADRLSVRLSELCRQLKDADTPAGHQVVAQLNTHWTGTLDDLIATARGILASP